MSQTKGTINAVVLVYDPNTMTFGPMEQPLGTSGTEYFEDQPAASDPVGGVQLLVRKDTPAATVTTDGDNIARRGSNYGGAYTHILDSSGNIISNFDFSSTNYATRVDEASSTVTYVGEAVAGVATSAASWRIKKLDSTSGLIMTWADGNTNFDNIWDNRASLSYS